MPYHSFDFCVFLDMEFLENVDGGEPTFEGDTSMLNNEEDRNAETIAPPTAPLSEPGSSGVNQPNRASRVTRPSKYRQIVTCLLQNLEA